MKPVSSTERVPAATARQRFRSLIVLAATMGALGPALRAGVDVSIAAEIRLGRVAPPAPPEVVVIAETQPPGPPPWAPGRWFKSNRVYYYYPASGVYFRPADRSWFYLEGGAWRVGVTLPDSIAIDFGRSVRLTMETEQPQQFHRQVVAYYPVAYFGTRVRLRDEPAVAETAIGLERGGQHKGRGGPPHERGPGVGQGKGRGHQP